MKSIALVYCPGDWELGKPPAGIAYLSAYIKEKGYAPLLFDYNLELFTGVIMSQYKAALSRGMELLKTENGYDIVELENYYFYMQLNYKYILEQVSLLKRWLLNSEEAEIPCDSEVYEFFNIRAEQLSRFDVVGFSVIFDDQIDSASCLALMVKRKNPACNVIAGGTAVSFKDFKSVTDGMIFGDGEEQLFRYLQQLEDNEGNAAKALSMKVHFTCDLDKLPLPDFAALFEKYRYISPVKVIPLPVTRGCYWGRCMFCSYGWTESHTDKATAEYRKMSPAIVVDQMEFFKSTLGAEHFFFSVDVSDSKHLEQISNEIIQRGIKVYWRTETRAEKSFLRNGLLKKLYLSGLRTVSFGLESVNRRVLDKMNKGVSPENIEVFIEKLSEAGIGINTDFFIGFPTETPEEAVETQQFIYDRNEKLLNYSPGGTFIVFAKSKIARDREFDGLKFIPETSTWIKKGMSFAQQERQQKVFCTNLVTDTGICRFPARNDGVFYFIYTSRYSIPELAGILKSSLNFIRIFSQLSRAFESTLYYLSCWGYDINNSQCIDFCRIYWENIVKKFPEGKTGMLEIYLEMMRTAVEFFQLTEDRQSIIKDTLKLDYCLLAACIGIGKEIPQISVSMTGNFEIRDLDSLYLVPSSPLTSILTEQFIYDVGMILERKEPVSLKQTYAVFDINGAHITGSTLTIKLLQTIMENKGRCSVMEIMESHFSDEEWKDLLASLAWLRDEGIFMKGVQRSKNAVDTLLDLMERMEKGEISISQAKDLLKEAK